jgi:hypothetical protein
MRDLDHFVRSIANLSSEAIYHALAGEAVSAEKIILRRASPCRLWEANKREAARRYVERIERILFFLRHQTPVFGATEDDLQLCRILEAGMRAKGEWHGVHQRITRSLLRAVRSAMSHLSRQVADVAAMVMPFRTPAQQT